MHECLCWPGGRVIWTYAKSNCPCMWGNHKIPRGVFHIEFDVLGASEARCCLECAIPLMNEVDAYSPDPDEYSAYTGEPANGALVTNDGCTISEREDGVVHGRFLSDGADCGRCLGCNESVQPKTDIYMFDGSVPCHVDCWDAVSEALRQPVDELIGQHADTALARQL